jgi:hypothetical protein
LPWKKGASHESETRVDRLLFPRAARVLCPGSTLRQNLQTGAIDTVYQAKGRVPFMDAALDVSPDEKWMLLGQIDRRESDIMIVDLD